MQNATSLSRYKALSSMSMTSSGAEHGLQLTLNIERSEDMAGPVSGIGVLVRAQLLYAFIQVVSHGNIQCDFSCNCPAMPYNVK